MWYMSQFRIMSQKVWAYVYYDLIRISSGKCFSLATTWFQTMTTSGTTWYQAMGGISVLLENSDPNRISSKGNAQPLGCLLITIGCY